MSKISIITPCYCPEEYYLIEYFQSIAAQTLSRDLFEVIFILNGPRHPYEDLITRLKGTIIPDIVFKLFYIPKAGVASAMNFGMEKSDGDYITFVDCDDYISSKYLENLYFHRNPSVVAAANGLFFYDKTGQFFGTALSKIFDVYPCGYEIRKLREKRLILNSAARKLFPHGIIGDKRFRTVLGFDSLFTFEVAGKKKIRNIITSKDAIYYCRCRPNSESRQKRDAGYLVKNFVANFAATSRIFFLNPGEYSFRYYLMQTAALFKATVLAIIK